MWTRNPAQCSCLSSFPLKETLRPLAVVVSPKFFHLISQSPRMFFLYLSILCVSSRSFSAALSVLVFNVPMVMLSFPRIFDDAPIACLTPPVLMYGGRRGPCDPGRRLIRYGMSAGFSHGDSRAKCNLTEPIPLQVEHVAVELVVEPFRPSGPSLRTMKTSALWCPVDTSYFTHNWETRGGREHLIASRTNPMDLPIALISFIFIFLLLFVVILMTIFILLHAFCLHCTALRATEQTLYYLVYYYYYHYYYYHLSLSTH